MKATNQYPGGKRQSRLTLRQRRFAVALVGPAKGNQAEAARIAGYAGNRRQLATQGAVNMKNENIQKMVTDTLDGMAQHALERLGEGLDAMKTKSFVTKAGAILKGDLEVDYASRLRSVQLWDRLRQRRAVSGTDSAAHSANDQEPAGGEMEKTELPEQGEAAKDIVEANDLLAQLKALNEKARELAAQATGAGDYRTALMAVRELTRLLELTAKLTGELDERAQRNELHVHLAADRALAVAKAYVERHGAGVVNPHSPDLAEVGEAGGPADLVEPFAGNAAAVSTITEGDNVKENQQQQ